jgi:hypothetical protein
MALHGKILSFTVIVLIAACAVASEPADPEGIALFESKIRPILVQHCYGCHSSESKEIKGGLLVDSRKGLLAGGESGPAIVPGRPDEGWLLDALKHESFEMPPDAKLSDQVVADFETWIKRGAPDPREGEPGAVVKRPGIDIEAGREFWAFRPISVPDPLPVQQMDWSRQPLDRFVLARLEQAGLAPSPDADPRTLIRRLTFDLIGLPPSPEEIEAFEAAAAIDLEQALAQTVDRLLASQHFGERWGRHWLDVIRYADSTGGARTRIFPDAWRFRDYVLDSVNADKPLDQLIREHIAGDLMPARDRDHRSELLTATGFLVLGPTNYETQDKELLRMDVIDEQIDTIGRAFLGMTIGCARCHDHKFDPIPTADYYALAGIFRSTRTLTPGNVSGWMTRELPMPPEEQARRDAWEAELAALTERLTAAKGELTALTGRATPGKNKALASLPGIVVDDTAAIKVGDWTASTSASGFVHTGYLHDGATGKGEKSVTFRFVVPTSGEYEIRFAYTASTNRAKNVPVTVHHADGESKITVDQTKPPTIDGTFVSLGRFRLNAATEGMVVVSNRGTSNHVIVDAVQLLAVGSESAAPGDDEPTARELAAMESIKAKVSALEKALADHKKTAPPGGQTVMSVEDESKAEDYHICIRGNVRNLGDKVPRSFLQVAMTREQPPEISEGHSGRLELAEWITSDTNPLTSRVMVNRIWLHLFGAGLVRTPDNFGATGQMPTHPELLDHLASEFQRDGWSIKAMVRHLVLSRTYRMASHDRPDALAVDTENRLLWRQNPQRLEGEAIRDAILAVSGRIDLSYGGPSIKRGTGNEFNYSYDSLRRAVYVPAFRTSSDPILGSFDQADPNLVVGQRNRTTLPTQALVLMNSPFVMTEARHAAERLLAEPDMDDAGRLDRLYQRALGRAPSQGERTLVLNYLRDTDPQDTAAARTVWTRICQSVFACIDFRYVH